MPTLKKQKPAMYRFKHDDVKVNKIETPNVHTAQVVDFLNKPLDEITKSMIFQLMVNLSCGSKIITK